jgi:hypothetical protein
VPVQPRGSKPPFFYVPSAASTALSAVKYARYLGTVQPVYGLQPLGFDEGEVPHNRGGGHGYLLSQGNTKPSAGRALLFGRHLG